MDEFQSLIGRLKTHSRALVIQREYEFQSLIGRLKTDRRGVGVYPARHLFQSLIGRLKTKNGGGQLSSHSTFQSLIGRLKTAIAELVYERVIVSIPHR